MPIRGGADTHFRPLPGAPPRPTLPCMGINQIRQRVERRQVLASAGPPPAMKRSQAIVYERCTELAEAAQELERVAATGGTEDAVPAALGCVTSTFESLANSMLMMRGVVLRAHENEATTPPEAERLARLLYAIDQNLRFAAHAADLGCRGSAEAPVEASESVRAG
jgi:hypothetical protein